MSVQRHCEEFLATDGKWYLELGDFEYAEEPHECTIYGPFDSPESLQEEYRHHANPGGGCTDDSGTRPAPKDVVAPSKSRSSSFDFGSL